MVRARSHIQDRSDRQIHTPAPIVSDVMDHKSVQLIREGISEGSRRIEETLDEVFDNTERSLNTMQTKFERHSDSRSILNRPRTLRRSDWI